MSSSGLAQLPKAIVLTSLRTIKSALAWGAAFLRMIWGLSELQDHPKKHANRHAMTEEKSKGPYIDNIIMISDVQSDFAIATKQNK